MREDGGDFPRRTPRQVFRNIKDASRMAVEAVESGEPFMYRVAGGPLDENEHVFVQQIVEEVPKERFSRKAFRRMVWDSKVFADGRYDPERVVFCVLPDDEKVVMGWAEVSEEGDPELEVTASDVAE